MSITNVTLRAAIIAAALLPAGARADDLSAEVAARLRESGSLQGYKVNVKAKSGTVWLEGRVADERQLAAAVGIAEASPGVERVVNRLTVAAAPPAAGGGFGLPASMRSYAAPAPEAAARQPAPRGDVRLAQAEVPAAPTKATGMAGLKPFLPSFMTKSKPSTQPAGELQQTAYNRTAMRGGPMMGGPTMGGPMTLPAPDGMAGMGGVADGQIVPGSMRYAEGGPMGDGGMVAGAPGGYADGAVAGGPMPMGGTGVGMPPIPMRGDGPNMPNYAWPSYAAYPNYAALQYPTQYSPTAWPYIGPFYPYPQVPLGWRRVSLEWDDGWWWLDFDERHVHSHHR
jgi:hypothetical protein